MTWLTCPRDLTARHLYPQSWYYFHYNDVIMGAMASQITSLTIVYITVYSGAYQRKHQSPTSLAFVWGIHRWTGEFPAQIAVKAENVSIWWRHHIIFTLVVMGSTFVSYQGRCPDYKHWNIEVRMHCPHLAWNFLGNKEQKNFRWIWAVQRTSTTTTQVP